MKSSPSVVSVLLAVLVLAACRSETQPPATTTQPASKPATEQVAQQAAAPASAQVLVDYRQPLHAASKSVPEAEQHAVVAAVFGSGAPDDVWVVDRQQGSFTAAGRQQTLYLLQRGQSQPGDGDRPPMLALIEAGKPIAQFVPREMPFARIDAVIDQDRDGIDEILLSADHYQMGQQSSAAQLLSLAGGKRQALETYREVFLNTCDAPFAEQPQVSASVFTWQQHKLVRQHYVAPCQQGNSRPDPKAFSAATAQPE